MREKPPACASCPAFTKGKGFVPSSGPSDAAILIVGQGPGEDEYWQGRPFVGRSGRTLNSWLEATERSDLERPNLRVTNVCLCWLPENRKPTRDEVAHCRTAHWGKELAGRSAVVAVGVPAMTALGAPKGRAKPGQIWFINPKEYTDASLDTGAGGSDHPSETVGVEESHNAGAADPGLELLDERSESGDRTQPQEALDESPEGEPGEDGPECEPENPSGAGPHRAEGEGDIPVIGLLHPAALLRAGGGTTAPARAQVIYLRRALDLARGWRARPAEDGPPGMILWPTLEQIEDWCYGRVHLSVDIECAGTVLTQLNLARLDTLESMPVRLRGPDAIPWPWGHDGWRRLVRALWTMLSRRDLHKVFHNGQAFDIWILEWNGFECNACDDDTLLLGHLAFPGMQGSLKLETLATTLLGTRHWKYLSSDSDGEGK